MNTELQALDAPDKAIAKATGEFDGLRKRADDIFEARADAIQIEQGVTRHQALAMAADDDIGKRAYALSTEFAEKHRKAISAGRRSAAFVGS